MNRKAALFLMGLMFTAMLGPSLVSAAVPHEDPNAAASSIDSLSFLSQYADIFSLMSSGHYENASQLSEQMSHITVPADLSYIISKYNDLTQQLIVQLYDLDATLNNASSLLDQHRLTEARQALDHAGVVVSKAQILLTDLGDATATVSQKLGVFGSLAGSKLREAYSELQIMLDRLQELIDRYHQLLAEANKKYDGIEAEKLKSTSLTLQLNSTECFVGGYVKASGVLSTSGQVLANRAVTVDIDGKENSTVKTNSEGSFEVAMQIPYKYVSSVSIRAFYAPEGDDKSAYLGCSSPTIKLKILYYKTILEISAPKVAYTGQTLTVTGKVTAQNNSPLSQRHVTVALDGSAFYQGITNENGTFTAKTPISSAAKLGNHTLKVSVDPSGLYAGATVQRILTVNKLTTYLEVDAPTFAVLPSQMEIKGSVRSSTGPLGDANVTIVFANASASVRTLNDGSFSLKLDVPLNTAFAGDQTLLVSAKPVQAWQATAETELTVFVLNAVSIGLASVSSFAIVFFLGFRFAKNNKKNLLMTEAVVGVPEFRKEVPVTAPAGVSERRLEGFKGRVLKAYVEAVGVVQSVTGFSASPTMTLREYVQLVKPKLEVAFEVFSDLTALTEKTLYSAQTVDEADANRAKELATTLRRINGGVA